MPNDYNSDDSNVAKIPYIVYAVTLRGSVACLFPVYADDIRVYPEYTNDIRALRTTPPKRRPRRTVQFSDGPTLHCFYRSPGEALTMYGPPEEEENYMEEWLANQLAYDELADPYYP